MAPCLRFLFLSGRYRVSMVHKLRLQAYLVYPLTKNLYRANLMNVFTERSHSNTLLFVSRIAALCFLLTGAGHLDTEALMRPGPVQDEAFLLALRTPRINLMGRSVSFEALSSGFSCAMGTLLLAFSLVQWNQKSRNSWVGFAAAVVLSVIAVKSFFIVPTLLMITASLAYGFLLIVRS